jgi:ribonuclease R
MLDEDNYQVIGRRYGKCYKLCDPVHIRVKGVDMLKKLIDFDLVEEDTFDDLAAPQDRRGRTKTNAHPAKKAVDKSARSHHKQADSKADGHPAKTTAKGKGGKTKKATQSTTRRKSRKQAE